MRHSILVVAVHILDRSVPYRDLGADWFLRRHDPECDALRLARQVEGFNATITPSETA